MMAWRQKQQVAKKELEAKRAAWQAEADERVAAVAAVSKEECEAARAVKRAKVALEDVVAKQQGRLDRIATRNAIRCAMSVYLLCGSAVLEAFWRAVHVFFTLLDQEARRAAERQCSALTASGARCGERWATRVTALSTLPRRKAAWQRCHRRSTWRPLLLSSMIEACASVR